MPVEIVYTNFATVENADPGLIKELMSRDASWGTHIDLLQAARATCGTDSYNNWVRTQPTITNLVKGRADDNHFSLAFPDTNFDFFAESVDHFVGTVAGDIVLNPNIGTIEVRDFKFTDPKTYDAFPGPNIGVDRLYTGFLSTLKGVTRPIVAFTVKPRFGMTVHELCKMYRAAAGAGIDIFEDDERLLDPPSCRFAERVKDLGKIQRDFETVYSANITGDSQKALERLDYCAEQGIRMVKMDVLVSGFETLRKVAQRIKDRYRSEIAITVYPDAYGAYRKLSREFILKLSRLCGADIIYAGSPNWARYEKEKGEFREAVEPIFQRHRLLAETVEPTGRIKSTLCTITNDQHPSRAEMITAYLRKHKGGHYRYAFFVGGGMSGFPSDIETAADVWMKCITHAATEDIRKYVTFDLSKYEKELEKIGWHRLDVQKGLNG
jgi:ribulose 1,5-bisphosphate carboxylase large subunit-like protein